MVSISKEEKEIIEKRLPDAHIVRTMKQKSHRHHYFCEETSRAMNLLKRIRSESE